MPTTRSQKKAAAVAAAELKLATPLTVDEYVYHLKSGLSFFSWYGADSLSTVLGNLVGRKIVGKKSLNVSRKELTTSRNWRWTTPLIMATQLPDDASVLIREMIEVHGCDPNFKDAYGMSPLYFALAGGNKKHAKVLLDAGAELEMCHYNPVGGPNFDGRWENVDLKTQFADVLAELRA
jgi:ankyrin repeat protein